MMARMRMRMTMKSRRQLFVLVVPVLLSLSASMLLKVTSLATRNNTRKIAKVAFVSSSQSYSGYGVTSPEPNPTWNVVADQLAKRLPNFAEETSQPTSSSPQKQPLQQKEAEDSEELIETQSFDVAQLQPTDLNGFDVVVALGVGSTTENSNNNNKVNKEEEEQRFLKALDHCSSNSNISSNGNGNGNNNSNIVALLADPTCSSHILNRRFAGKYGMSSSSSSSDNSATASTRTTNAILQEATASIPWTDVASSKRLLEKTDVLFKRKSSEDYIFAILFVINALVRDIDVVKSDINPSWEKGPIQNIKEFKNMIDCCGPQIQAAMSDPQSKKAIDLLNAVDLRDQVGSYRVIVSNETPQLEEFTLCILQQNNCFNCNSPILEKPKVPLLQQWRGKPLDEDGARQILIGHLDHPDAAAENTQKLPWSWKIVVGANPAYDAFPMQHQIFYPTGGTGTSKSKSLWYDPVFCVETLDGDLTWCKRHYRVTPRKHWSSSSQGDDADADTTTTPTTSTTAPGAWTLTTLDNGMVSEERWTTVDAADDLSWTILHYSGAAKRAGQSYVGALLCTPDGLWPESAKTPDSDEYKRIAAGFKRCDLELWELFGGSTKQSYMWSTDYTSWADNNNPPPLDPIGDISITAWRKQEREKALIASSS